MDFSTWIASLTKNLMATLPRIGVILLVFLVGLRLIKVFSNRVVSSVLQERFDNETQKRAQTLATVVRHLFNLLFAALAMIMILDQIGIKVGTLLATAGVAGLAIGFGAQSLVKDVISGFFILLEDQIRVGDVVKIADLSGLVEKMNLKMTVLRDLQGHVHFIPNGSITTVTNMTKNFSYYLMDVGVAYREDVDQVMQVMRKVAEDLSNDPDYQGDIMEPLEILGLDRFADSAVVIRARIKTLPIKQWRVGREFNRRLKIKFDELNIEIPFPHVTLYMGQDQNGQAPPLVVRLAEQKQASSPTPKSTL